MAAGLRFKEQLDGYFGPNLHSFKDGEDYGIRHENIVLFDIKVEIDSIGPPHKLKNKSSKNKKLC